MTTNIISTKKPKLLLTGSEGSLAQWCIKRLELTYDIVGVDNFSRYGFQDRDRSYVFEQVNLTNLTEVDTLFSKYKFDYVLHCAAQIYGVKGFHIYSADILNNNTVSTANLLASCVQHQIKKIAFISSSMVYENAIVFPLREEYTDTIAPPTTGYGMSKLIGERMLKEYRAQYGLNYVVWRPFNIVTPHERSDREPGIAHVMADFIEKIIFKKDPVIEIFGDGNQIRCFTWIDDIAKIISEKSFDSITDDQIYNVGSETPTRIIDLAKMIYQQSNRTDFFNPKFIDIYTDDVKLRIPDCSKAKTIGWSHTKTIEELVYICTHNES